MKEKLLILIIIALLVNIESNAQKPIMLDDIHYYVSDSTVRNTAVNYFKNFFKGREMAEQPINPLSFIDFISLRPDESTLNISSPGPFPGIKVGDPKRWERDKVKPDPKNPPMYGVRWLAINTKSIRKTVKQLLKEGYEFAAGDFTLPTEPNVNAVAMYGFDYNIIVLVERPQLKSKSTFGIDHLQLIVKNLEENVKFFQDVLAAEIIDKKERSTVLKVGNHKFVLSEPEALGLSREQVVERDPKKFVANIDHLGFLYDDIEPAFYAAKANNYKIVMEPQQMMYFEKPTPYTFCILMSPDNLQIELEQEEGRVTARKLYKTAK
ncbi:MAG: VOC family protein [Arcicella sp.]|jgi:catechol 2,3-dioxygenase-like lactoylglutathione lyase family enzyme|nr:VOC family protein [Arcicella sp.]